MLTNAKSVLTFETGVIPGKSIHFPKGNLVRNSNYATNFLLEDKLKIENSETLNYVEIKRIMIFSALYLCDKTIVPYKFPCFEDPYCSEHI